MAELYISSEARDDLKEIKRYISDELHNSAAAVRIVSRITKAIRGLKRFPDSGSPLVSHAVEQTDYRFLVVGSYLVFYLHVDKTVKIVRVLNGRRDTLSILFSGTPQKDMQ